MPIVLILSDADIEPALVESCTLRIRRLPPQHVLTCVRQVPSPSSGPNSLLDIILLFWTRVFLEAREVSDAIAVPADAAFTKHVDICSAIAFGDQGGDVVVVVAEVDLDLADHLEMGLWCEYVASLAACLAEACDVGEALVREDEVGDLSREADELALLLDMASGGFR